jgi:hypothetical protein
LTIDQQKFAEGDLSYFSPSQWREMANGVQSDEALGRRISAHRRQFLRDSGMPMVNEHDVDLLRSAFATTKSEASSESWEAIEGHPMPVESAAHFHGGCGMPCA